MRWIEQIRQKSNHEKIKIIWLTAGVMVVILIITWIAVGQMNTGAEKDLRFFQSLKQGASGLDHSLKNLPLNK